MRRLLLSAVAALALCGAAEAQVGPPNQVQCNKLANFTGSATNAQVIAPIAGAVINICGWHVTNTAATGTFQFVYGTGSTCTSQTAITPALNVTSTAPSADHIDFASFSVPAGATLCENGTATTVTGVVWYSQQ